MLSPHFSAAELSVERASADDVDRYRVLCSYTLEVLRIALDGTGITIISGHRTLENNRGRSSSHHLSPADRTSLSEQVSIGARMALLDRSVWKDIQSCNSAAADVRHGMHPPEMVFAVCEVLMTRRTIPVGGLFWYPPRPDGRGGFVHVDNRGRRAREAGLTPPTVVLSNSYTIAAAVVDSARPLISRYLSNLGGMS